MPKKKADRSTDGYWTAIAFALQLESRYRKKMASALLKSKFNLSVREWHALAYVASCRADELSVLGRWSPTRAGIMRALDIDKAAASRLVAGLIHKKYLTELRSTVRDGRVKVLVPALYARNSLGSLLKIEQNVMQELSALAGMRAAKDLQAAMTRMGRAFTSVALLEWNDVSQDDA